MQRANRVGSEFAISAGAALRLDRRLRRRQHRLRQRHHQRHDDEWRRQHELEPNDDGSPWRRTDRRELPVRAYGVRVRDRRGRDESKRLQRYAHCEHDLVRDGACAARICLRPDSLLRDRRRGIRPVLQFRHHDLARDRHGGLDDGNVAANRVGGGRRKRACHHPELDPAIRISLPGTARQLAKFGERHPGNLQRERVQPDRASGSELQIQLARILPSAPTVMLRWRACGHAGGDRAIWRRSRACLYREPSNGWAEHTECRPRSTIHSARAECRDPIQRRHCARKLRHSFQRGE
jgi:hypothetical protein